MREGFAVFFEQQVALEFAEVVEEHDAVEMVNFVLEAAAEKAFGLEGLGGAVFIQVANLDPLMALDDAVEIGEAEAAFFAVHHLWAGCDEGGVDHEDAGDAGGGGAVPFFALHFGLDDDEFLENADLRRGEADALCRVEGGDHVGQGGAGFISDLCDRGRGLAQRGVWVDGDGKDFGVVHTRV